MLCGQTTSSLDTISLEINGIMGSVAPYYMQSKKLYSSKTLYSDTEPRENEKKKQFPEVDRWTALRMRVLPAQASVNRFAM